MRPFRNALITQQFPRFIYQISVPGGAQSCTAGQTCGGDAGKEFRAPDTIWTVGGTDRGDVEFWDRICVPEINSCFC
jgi:hypothetical protein